MSRRGENIYKRKDGRWEGRYKPDGFLGKYKYVYAHTYKETKEKLTQLIRDNLSLIEQRFIYSKCRVN